MDKPILVPVNLSSLLQHHESGHFRYRGSWATERADPPDHLLIWVTSGNMDVRINGSDAIAGPGDVVLFEPGLSHRYRPHQQDGWEWFWLHCGGSAVPELWSQLQGSTGPIRTLGHDPLIRSRFAELVTSAAAAPIRSGPPGDRIRVHSCAYSLLGLMLDRLTAPGRAGEGDRRTDLSALTTWILEQLGSPITVSDLVRESGWSSAQLNRLTRREIGLAPLQYVGRLRMARAERLLVDTELTVAEVATLVGFEDPLHFSRRFRQLTGRPPSQARRG